LLIKSFLMKNQMRQVSVTFLWYDDENRRGFRSFVRLIFTL